MKKGVYIRGLTKENDPYAMAEQAAKNGITFAAFMIYWQEAEKNKRVNSTVLAEYTKVFAEYGIEPWVWGYPWCGKDATFIARLNWAKSTCAGRLRGFILDPELGYQGHRVGLERAKLGAEQLVSGVIDVMNEGMDLGVTSFGCAHVHKTFPWEEFCAGFGSPQFYKTTERHHIRQGLSRWKEAGWQTLIPSVPAFGPNSGQNLVPYLDKIKIIADDLEIPIEGWIFWSYQQLGDFEWEAIRSL